MESLLTIWLPVAVTALAAARLHRRAPVHPTARALRALERVVEPEPKRPALRLVVDNTRGDVAA